MLLHLTRCTLDLDRRRLLRADGTEEALGTLDADVLRFLADHEGEVVTYDDLLVEVWGFRAEHPRGVVQTQMSRLRTLIGDDPKSPMHLFTVRGTGYRFRLPVLPEEPGAARRAIAVVHGAPKLPPGGAVVAQEGRLAVVAFPDTDDALTWLSEVAASYPEAAAGLHHGEVVREAGVATLGGAVVHIARLVARTARPGMLLATAAAHERSPEPAGGDWRPLGAYRLPELGRAETLWRWVPSGLDVPEAGPDAEPVLAGHLPRPETPFVGRREELGRVTGHLDGDARCVTVVGIGGFGKTRLALEIARRFPGARAFADLTEARSLADLVTATAEALGVRLDPGADGAAGLERVAEALAEVPGALLVVDNVEQILDPARHALATWQAAAPDVRFLVTSRVPLGFADEVVVQLGPLAPPDAVALLRDRARTVAPSFDDDPDLLAAIVERLDGIPLAIELLAGRARVLSAREMRDHLEGRFAVLRARDGGRHGDLREILDWSWELLDPGARDVLARLSVFRGGFTASAAEAVLGLPPGEVLDALQTLRDLAWVQGAGARLALLETVRAFASRRLDPATRQSLEERHAEWIVEAAEGWATEVPGAGLPRLQAERPNLVAARERIAERTPTLAARALLAEEALVRHQGGSLAPLGEAVDTLADRLPSGRLRDRLLVRRAGIAISLADVPALETALGAIRPDTDPDVRGEVEMARGYALFALRGGQKAARIAEAGVHYAAAREAFVAAGDRAGAQRAAYRVAYNDFLSGRFAEALDALRKLLADRALAPARAAEAWIAVGRCHGRLGRIDEALAAFETAAAMPEEAIGHLAAEAAEGIAWVETQRDRWDRAILAYERVLALHRSYDDRLGEAACLNDLADVARHMGDLDRAEAGYLESLRRHHVLGTRDAIVRLNLALVHLLRGRDGEARAVLARVLAEDVEPHWAAAAHVLSLPGSAGDEAWTEHLDQATALLDATGFVDDDLATACELAARRATEAGHPDRAAAAWALAASQWEGLGDAQAARRAREWLRRYSEDGSGSGGSGVPGSVA